MTRMHQLRAFQVLIENGYDAGNLSVDRTDEQYLTFIDMMIDGRVKFSRQVADLIETELFDLVHFRQRRKVDHTPEGSKDVMDAVVGAVWNAVTSSKEVNEQMVDDLSWYKERNSESDEEEFISMDFLTQGYEGKVIEVRGD